jgi:isoleucyl-tRNA synthetase
MPWGQWGYPAEPGSKELVDSQYPGDFICEAIDQTRGWFYTMLAASTMLTDRSSYKNVICTALISDESGHKMSKSRGNVVDPVELCDKYGADAVRLSFYTVNPWIARRFNEADIVEGLKQVIIPYWNAYSFLVTYARVDKWRPQQNPAPSTHLLDRWILSRLEGSRQEIEKALDNYDVTAAAGAIITFSDELTNWYIRRSRRRFWKSEDDLDKSAAYATLYKVIVALNRMLAPFMPMVTETIFQNLERAFVPEADDSVHLSKWPQPAAGARDAELERVMAVAREIASLARSLRNEGSVRVRQPLPEIVVKGVDESLSTELEELILDELNVKSIRFVSDDRELINHSAKADFKLLGPRLGGRLKAVSSAIAELGETEILNLLESDSIVVEGEKIARAEIIVTELPREGFWIRSEGGLTVALEHRISDELRREGLAREFVHHVQNLRKELDLEVTQRIKIAFNGTEQLYLAVENHRQYITAETLALELVRNHNLSAVDEIKIGDQAGKIQIYCV